MGLKWVKFTKRKPPKTGDYYWKGKSGYGGKDYYDAEEEKLLFGYDTPVNKVSLDCLYWLDEYFKKRKKTQHNTNEFQEIQRRD